MKAPVFKVEKEDLWLHGKIACDDGS